MVQAAKDAHERGANHERSNCNDHSHFSWNTNHDHVRRRRRRGRYRRTRRSLFRPYRIGINEVVVTFSLS